MEERPRNELRTTSIHDRKSLVHVSDMMEPYRNGMPTREWLESLPRQLAGNRLRTLVKAITKAAKEGKSILLLFGAHLIKCGLSRLVIQWIEKGLLRGLATNGAGSIHDFELALAGHTSEDVAESIRDGSFGMCRETSSMLNAIVSEAAGRGLGMGEAIGAAVEEKGLPHRDVSVLRAAWKQGIPATVHVALGTDIIHPHPSADGAAIGRTGLEDYRRFERLVQGLDQGVVLLFGSAVILPEVFLKALSAARNLGFPVTNLTVANFDMIQHYRPTQNVLRRPTLDGGTALSFTGHHEIMFPLLTAAVFEAMEEAS